MQAIDELFNANQVRWCTFVRADLQRERVCMCGCTCVNVAVRDFLFICIQILWTCRPRFSPRLVSYLHLDHDLFLQHHLHVFRFLLSPFLLFSSHHYLYSSFSEGKFATFGCDARYIIHLLGPRFVPHACYCCEKQFKGEIRRVNRCGSSYSACSFSVLTLICILSSFLPRF